MLEARRSITLALLLAAAGITPTRAAQRSYPLRVRGGRKSSSGSSSGRATAASAPSGGATTHRVRQGDNLWLIAQRYGTTVERIKRDNGLNGNLLKVGQKLVIGG